MNTPLLSCANCTRDIFLGSDGRLPPWCPHCGVDYKEASGEKRKESLAAVAAALDRAPVAPLRRFSQTPLPSAPAGSFTPAEPPLHPSAALPPAPAEEVPTAELAEPVAPDAPTALASAGWGSLNVGALAIAGLLLLGCLWLSNSAVDKLTSHQQVPGQVVRVVVGRKGRTYPVVAYSYRGKAYQFQGSSSGPYRVGEPVDVLVPPGQPGQGSINNFTHLWVGPLLTGVLGAGCLWIGLTGRRRRAS